jgi:hypothetical protein
VTRRLAISAFALLLAACEGMAGGSTVTSVVQTVYPPKPDDCPIVVFRSGRPGGDSQVVARLTARVEGPEPPGGDLAAVLPELKKQACRAGADGIGWLSVQRSAGSPRAVVGAMAVRFPSAPR